MSNLSSTSALTSTSSSIQTRKYLETLRNIDLIGTTTHQIVGAKLPSNRQVLQVFFHNMRYVNLSAKESATLAIKAVVIFWQQARIPTRYDSRCVEKLEKLYDTWKTIRKNAPERRSDAMKKTEQTFVDNLDDLFDIASVDAMKTIRIEEDKQFLIMQRQKGRPGCMLGTDMNSYGREKRSSERREKEEFRKKKYEESGKNDIMNA